MRFGPAYRVPFRRRRTFKTNYRNRLKLLSSSLPRAIVRRSLKQISVQFAEYDERGDRILSSTLSKELKKYGWSASTSTTPSAYLTGFLAARKALASGVTNAVLDIGLYKPTRGGKLFAALKGILDAGISIECGEDIFPSEDRIRGKHLGEEVPKQFESVKSKLEALEWKQE